MMNMTNRKDSINAKDATAIEKSKKKDNINNFFVAETLEKYEVVPNSAEIQVPQSPKQGQNSEDTDRILESAEKIQKSFLEKNIDLTEEDVYARLFEWITVYKVPPAEAERTVTNALIKKYNLPKNGVFAGRGAKNMKISEILEIGQKPDDQNPSVGSVGSAGSAGVGSASAGTNGGTDTASWASFDGKVIQLWENSHESIAQAGLLGDETGVVKFTLWNNTDLPVLELNQTYTFKNTLIKNWNQKVQIEMNRATTFELSDKEMKVLPSESGTSGTRGEKHNDVRKISELTKDGLWTDVYAKVVQVFEKTHESIITAGILGDETGTIRFTMWKTAECIPVEAEKTYLFSNVIVKEWNGKYAIELNRSSRVERVDMEIEVKSASFEMTGCAVDIQSGSGLVKRCPECSKVLSKGSCGDHGKVKGKHDLRIKAVFDDGKVAQEAILNRELTEKILNMTLEEAVLLTTETLDPESVSDRIKKEFLGKYYTVFGAKTDRYVIVETIVPANPVSLAAVSELKSKIELEQLEYELFGNKLGNTSENAFENESENTSGNAFENESENTSGNSNENTNTAQKQNSVKPEKDAVFEKPADYSCLEENDVDDSKYNPDFGPLSDQRLEFESVFELEKEVI
ncbi:hypothetical protein [Methanolapillus ohkumae]|uniref:Replication protein A n=1 Tax=Methanolapillus ohkumae TaxID=3028298 RepID=A0AA96ZW16_9EURY|nr:hypothetical protein MsAm2_13000 [Methanosarcinaceae archaeon Am2]